MTRRLIPFPIHAALAALVVLGLQSAAPAAAAATPTQANAPVGQLQIWNANLFSGSPDSDYRNFLSYIADPTNAHYAPDLLTVQEVGTHVGSQTQVSCPTVVADLESRTGRNYACAATNAQGNAAIIYRPSRLSLVRQSQFGLYRSNLTDCVLQTGNDWRGIVAGFQDTSTGKYVVASSLHLPVNGGPGELECAWKNSKRADAQVETMASSLPKEVKARVMAGDWNAQDSLSPAWSQPAWEYWYKCVNRDLADTCAAGGGSLGWKDAMARACGRLSSDPATWLPVYSCLHEQHATRPDRDKRIDFLFTKSYAIADQITVPYEDAHADSAQDYSNHRGQGALIALY